MQTLNWLEIAWSLKRKTKCQIKLSLYRNIMNWWYFLTSLCLKSTLFGNWMTSINIFYPTFISHENNIFEPTTSAFELPILQNSTDFFIYHCAYKLLKKPFILIRSANRVKKVSSNDIKGSSKSLIDLSTGIIGHSWKVYFLAKDLYWRDILVDIQ